MVDFSIKTDGLKLNISDLQEPVELFIPLKVDANRNNNGSEQYFIKPSRGAENIQYHRISFTQGAAAFVKIKPLDDNVLEVYISHRVKPTPKNYDYSTIVPDYSTCSEFSKMTGYFNCSSDPYTFSISSRLTGHAGLHFLGIRYAVNDSVTTSDDVKESAEERARDKRDCGSHSGRQKRSCIGVKDPPTTPPPTPKIIIPQYDINTDVNYTLSVTVSSCMYWSETKQEWTDEGCKVN